MFWDIIGLFNFTLSFLPSFLYLALYTIFPYSICVHIFLLCSINRVADLGASENRADMLENAPSMPSLCYFLPIVCHFLRSLLFQLVYLRCSMKEVQHCFFFDVLGVASLRLNVCAQLLERVLKFIRTLKRYIKRGFVIN